MTANTIARMMPIFVATNAMIAVAALIGKYVDALNRRRAEQGGTA